MTLKMELPSKLKDSMEALRQSLDSTSSMLWSHDRREESNEAKRLEKAIMSVIVTDSRSVNFAIQEYNDIINQLLTIQGDVEKLVGDVEKLVETQQDMKEDDVEFQLFLEATTNYRNLLNQIPTFNSLDDYQKYASTIGTLDIQSFDKNDVSTAEEVNEMLNLLSSGQPKQEEMSANDFYGSVAGTIVQDLERLLTSPTNKSNTQAINNSLKQVRIVQENARSMSDDLGGTMLHPPTTYTP